MYKEIPQKHPVTDKIEGDRIILSAKGKFPKTVIIYDKSKQQVYRIIKTKYGKFQLTK